jgi:hypothetical protein
MPTPRKGATKRNNANEQWLLVVVSTAGATSTLRVHVWRTLRALGAHYLHQSVCVLPDRPAPARAVNRLLQRVQLQGGEGRVSHITIADAAEEREIIAAFAAERSDEYGEVVARAPAFLEEIAMERARGRATYAEVEESAADLERLRTWLARIRARDYFGAPGAAEAEAAVQQCADALEAFESEAFRSEGAHMRADRSSSPRLRIINDA